MGAVRFSQSNTFDNNKYINEQLFGGRAISIIILLMGFHQSSVLFLWPSCNNIIQEFSTPKRRHAIVSPSRTASLQYSTIEFFRSSPGSVDPSLPRGARCIRRSCAATVHSSPHRLAYTPTLYFKSVNESSHWCCRICTVSLISPLCRIPLL